MVLSGSRRWIVTGSAVLAMAAAVPSTAAAVPADAPPGPGPRAEAISAVGWRGVQWTTDPVAAGVTVLTGTLHRPGAAPYWTVTIEAPAINDLTGQRSVAELGSAAWAQDTMSKLGAAGFPARQDVIDWPAEYSDTPRGVEGVRVRSGAFPTQTGAAAAADALRGAGFVTAAVEWTGYDADQPIDAESVHVAVIDPRRVEGHIEATLGGIVAQRQTTSSIAARLGALVATNGGYFVTSDADGYQGVPSGLAAYNGRLESESVGSRAALVLDRDRRPRIENLVSTVAVRAGDASHSVQGVNRRPGLVRDCGRPGLQPTSLPRQDVTCTDRDELVLFTSEFGASLPTAAGFQAVLDQHGTVTAVGPPGGTVPPGGSAVQGLGPSATWLSTHALVGTSLSVTEQIRDPSGHQVRLGGDGSIASAGPVLVRDGTPNVDAATEGVVDPRDLSFGYAFSEQRQPRTLAGIDGHGRLLLVTVDGREPGVSEGATLSEGAQLLRHLGSVQAMNLDGGGSSAMAVRGVLVNHPSDRTGERAIGDAIVVVPSPLRAGRP